VAHLILVNGKPLDPQKAAGAFLPLDLFYVCPDCGSKHVLAKDAKTIEDLGGQHKLWIPRQQDRWCQECGHRWTATLAPEIIAR
jgi:DNA-directed RNA polymerase subunit RPC12/RpoP